MGVVFRVQSLTFFFFSTCNTPRNTRQTWGMLLCCAVAMLTVVILTRFFTLRGKVCFMIVMKSSATPTGIPMALQRWFRHHVTGRTTSLWDYKVQTGWSTGWHSRPPQNWFTVTQKMNNKEKNIQFFGVLNELQCCLYVGSLNWHHSCGYKKNAVHLRKCCDLDGNDQFVKDEEQKPEFPVWLNH